MYKIFTSGNFMEYTNGMRSSLTFLRDVLSRDSLRKSRNVT